MSLSKVVTASADLTIPSQSIVYGIHLTAHLGATDPPAADPVIVELFNAATQAAGTASNKIAYLTAFAASPDGLSSGVQSILFPAGVRCLSGGSITITANGHNVSVTIDYS